MSGANSRNKAPRYKTCDSDVETNIKKTPLEIRTVGIFVYFTTYICLCACAACNTVAPRAAGSFGRIIRPILLNLHFKRDSCGNSLSHTPEALSFGSLYVFLYGRGEYLNRNGE